VEGEKERLPVVWIADDSATQTGFAQRALGARFRTETFLDGATVIERLSAAPALPDLLLLDWVMPGLSGDEVCRYLRGSSRTRELPIVILTASRTATADIVCALESGANDYVAKPFAPEELRARVDSILRRSALEETTRAMSRLLEEMMGVVAHDLRTPLSSLQLGIELLQSTASEGQGAVLTRSDRSARRMTKIVDLLLDVTRARLGAGIPVTLAPTSLREVVLAVFAEQRGIHPDIDFVVDGADTRGDWDVDRLEQVVSNIVGNAILYGRSKGRIEVTLSSDARNSYLVRKHELPGPPIDPAALATMFDPFARAGDVTNRDGLGLGLYIVREITRAHGGTIAATSDSSGTRFTLSLPT